MKTLVIIFFFSLVLMSCGSSKYSIGNSPELQALAGMLKKLDKDHGNESLRNDINHSYSSITKNLLGNIEVYETLSEPDRWDKIIGTYHTLQHLSDVIHKSKARNFIDAPSYEADIQVASQNAAATYYEEGMKNMDAGVKSSFRHAYELFSKANNYYPGYKDVKQQMANAFKESILNVVINPVTDQSSYYSQLGPNRFGNSFNSDLLQRSLVRDLGGDYSRNSPARFYTDREAYMANINVDWIIDIMWTNLDVPYPLTQSFTKKLSKEIQVSKDTSGKPIYKIVYATLYVTRRYFTARGELECRVTDAHTRENIDLKRYQSQVDWSQDYATYKGDPDALGENEWRIINNRVPLPMREDILMELYQKIYPNLKNGIYNLVY